MIQHPTAVHRLELALIRVDTAQYQSVMHRLESVLDLIDTAQHSVSMHRLEPSQTQQTQPSTQPTQSSDSHTWRFFLYTTSLTPSSAKIFSFSSNQDTSTTYFDFNIGPTSDNLRPSSLFFCYSKYLPYNLSILSSIYFELSSGDVRAY